MKDSKTLSEILNELVKFGTVQIDKLSFGDPNKEYEVTFFKEGSYHHSHFQGRTLEHAASKALKSVKLS